MGSAPRRDTPESKEAELAGICRALAHAGKRPAENRQPPEPFWAPVAPTRMDIEVTFPGGKRVDASLGQHLIRTDQARTHGGEGTAPEPFELFLASLATCAGIYVLGFCQAREIPTEGVKLLQHHRFDDATHRLEQVQLEIVLPPTFPEKYRASIAKAAEGCKVKRTLFSPPEVAVVVKIQSLDL